MSIQQKFSRLKAIIALAEEDMQKLTLKGNKTAGTRLRKDLLEIKELAAELRKEILDTKKVKVLD